MAEFVLRVNGEITLRITDIVFGHKLSLHNLYDLYGMYDRHLQEDYALVARCFWILI